MDILCIDSHSAHNELCLLMFTRWFRMLFICQKNIIIDIITVWQLKEMTQCLENIATILFQRVDTIVGFWLLVLVAVRVVYSIVCWSESTGTVQFALVVDKPLQSKLMQYPWGCVRDVSGPLSLKLQLVWLTQSSQGISYRL